MIAEKRKPAARGTGQDGQGGEPSAGSGGEPQLAAGPQGREAAPGHPSSDRSAPAGRPPALPCAAGRETAFGERCPPADRDFLLGPLLLLCVLTLVAGTHY